MERTMPSLAEPATLKSIRFSTENFPEKMRVEAYREAFGGTIARHDIETLGDRPFHFEADMWSLPGLGLASSSISPCRRSIRADHILSDDILFGVGLAGSCTLRQHRREVHAGTGEAVLTSSAHTAEVLITESTRPLTLRLPHAVLKSRIPGVDDLVARRIPRDTGGLSLLTGYIGAMRDLDLASPELRRLVVDHIYDLVSLVLGVRGDWREAAEQQGGRAARLAAILRAIERRTGDRNLSALTVANEFGITPRYVHLLLEETGKTFTHLVLERRLEKAVTLLRDPSWRNRTIVDVAATAGFTDVSYFNRTFRRHYDATPSDIRRSGDRDP
jgi:AraC-like DNA-binding protein